MVELRRDRPDRAVLLQDGREAGEARWRYGTLAWGRERVRVAQVEALTAPAEVAADFWDYLCYLWQGEAVAAVWRDGAPTWFSQALRAAWQAAGSPSALTPESPS